MGYTRLIVHTLIDLNVYYCAKSLLNSLITLLYKFSELMQENYIGYYVDLLVCLVKFNKLEPCLKQEAFVGSSLFTDWAKLEFLEI